MTGFSTIIQRVMAGLFALLAIVNIVIALALAGRADSGTEYLAYGAGALFWIIAGIGYLLAAASIMKPSDRWWVFALAAAAISAFLSVFVLPILLSHLLLDAAVIVGVLRWLMKRSTPTVER